MIWFGLFCCVVGLLFFVMSAVAGCNDTRTLDRRRDAIIVWWIMGFLLICFAIASVYGGTRDKCRKEAIDHGAAEFRCDPVTGQRSFEWLTEKKGE